MMHLLVLLLTIAAVNCENCERFNPTPLNFSDPNIIGYLENQIFYNLWNSSGTLSKDGENLESEMKTMFLSDNLRLKVTSLLGTQWIHTYISDKNHRPNLCGFAKIINNTVDSNKNCESLTDVLNSVFVLMEEGTNYALSKGLKASNCEDTENKIPVTISSEECYGDGKVYKINEFLEQEGESFSAEFKKTVLNLYSSGSHTDNIMALFTVAAMTKEFKTLEREFNPNLKFLVAIYAKGYPGTCCDEFINIVKSSANTIAEESKRLIKLVKSRSDC